ncbi:hypothetical protein AB4Y85_07645 [Microvirga sp. 2YAF29]|uniref:hypothetical protein n=1 Tax=Microvirga sp. 2YAF29 TaxID=3233031 RepID=UPI003F9AE957
MSKSAKPLFIIVLTLSLGGCVSQGTHELSATETGLDCAALSQELAANERQIVAAAGERSANETKNAVGQAAMTLLLPELSFIDLSASEKAKVDALLSRNRALKELAQSK